MPGIATRFEILRLVIDELKKPASGTKLNDIAANMEAHLPYAHLGVIGPALADFLPSGPPPPGDPLPETYAGVWKTIFQFVGGDLGLFKTLTDMRATLEKLDKIASDEDEDALLALKDSEEAEQIKQTTQTFQELVSGLKPLAGQITDMIGQGLRPNVCTSFPNDPVPPVNQWQPRDVMHWRKTGAFTSALLKEAKGTPAFEAYAQGWVVGYAAAVCGAPFLNSSVGGSARTQWWRQRLVRNYVDAWVFGFYRTTASMTGDTPSPGYADWPDLCEADLQKQIELQPLDAADLMSRIKRYKAFPENVLPKAFRDFWMEAYSKAYGKPSPDQGIDAAGLNDAYQMTWLVLWFMTSGAVLPCHPDEPMQPPQGCEGDPSEVDPFQIDPETGEPKPPPIPQAEKDVEINEAGVICGWIMAIVGGLLMAGGGVAAGGALLAGGIGLVNDPVDINWPGFRCQLFWLKMYVHLGLKGLHQLLAISGFGYPHAVDLSDDELSLEELDVPLTWATGKFLVRSRASAEDFPGKPWDGSKLTFNLPPTKFETPRTIAYRTAAYPNFFINDQVANPLANGDVKTMGSSFPFRPGAQASGVPGPIQFGNVVANAVDLFHHLPTALPDWNLDGDRGLAYLTWQFADNSYNPNNVQIKPAP